ncbi:MAG: hypothetical protein UX62_C0010G0011 [Microgenomates group bacterium GW2011_GWA2_46_7]|nr:MAG: hypothetical protein UX62_C0010G0011 [Microgenomates group bacterium GW2011_GWA2_46_7]
MTEPGAFHELTPAEARALGRTLPPDPYPMPDHEANLLDNGDESEEALPPPPHLEGLLFLVLKPPWSVPWVAMPGQLPPATLLVAK